MWRYFVQVLLFSGFYPDSAINMLNVIWIMFLPIPTIFVLPP